MDTKTSLACKRATDREPLSTRPAERKQGVGDAIRRLGERRRSGLRDPGRTIGRVVGWMMFSMRPVSRSRTLLSLYTSFSRLRIVPGLRSVSHLQRAGMQMRAFVRLRLNGSLGSAVFHVSFPPLQHRGAPLPHQRPTMNRKYHGHGRVPSQGMRRAFSGSVSCGRGQRSAMSEVMCWHSFWRLQADHSLSLVMVRLTGLGAWDQNGVALSRTSPLTSSGVCDATHTER